MLAMLLYASDNWVVIPETLKPKVPGSQGDVTYVLERPTARGFRLAVGTAWLATHRRQGEISSI